MAQSGKSKSSAKPYGIITKDIRKTYPEIPWQDVAGMRDKLIHQYFGVDIEKVWDTAKEDLPILKQQVLGILKDYGQEK
jgi:uncharacterized protein with HEPN domain